MFFLFRNNNIRLDTALKQLRKLWGHLPCAADALTAAAVQLPVEGVLKEALGPRVTGHQDGQGKHRGLPLACRRNTKEGRVSLNRTPDLSHDTHNLNEKC